MKFFIIVTGYDCERYIGKCMRSIAGQTFREFEAVFISDGSTDGSADALRGLEGIPNIRIECYKENKGAAFRRHEAIQKAGLNEEDVIVLVGMDDELKSNALELISRRYKHGCWMSYGNWFNQHGQINTVRLDFDEKTHANRDYRKVQYRSTAPNTFKAFLYNQLTEDDLQIDGKWLDTCTETNVMISCLEMCGREKIGIIASPIYFYNQKLPGGTIKRLGREYKDSVLANIQSRPKKPLYAQPVQDSI